MFEETRKQKFLFGIQKLIKKYCKTKFEQDFFQFCDKYFDLRVINSFLNITEIFFCVLTQNISFILQLLAKSLQDQSQSFLPRYQQRCRCIAERQFGTQKRFQKISLQSSTSCPEFHGRVGLGLEFGRLCALLFGHNQGQ